VAKRAIPDLAEIRDQIRRLRDDIANWRSLIESPKGRPVQQDQPQQADSDESPEGRKPSEK
jgi:hypothetical protein